MAPKSAKAARLYRLARTLQRTGDPSVPKSEAEVMVWVNSHIRRDADKALSKEEEGLREVKLPMVGGTHNTTAEGQAMQGSMFHYREFPMYPGEYVPADHDSLASIRNKLKTDIASQNIKDAWLRVSGGDFFNSVSKYYSRVEGLDEHQIGDIVAAAIPGFNPQESSELVTKVLESISKKDSTPSRELQRTISSEAVGLDNAPGHYSNFMEWMGRLTETKAFKTEHALFQFTRRQFNFKDVRDMNENLNLMSKATLAKESSDGYSHFYAVLKDFAVKTAGEDTRHQIGVRIDRREMDEETGIAIGSGIAYDRVVIAYIRENRDHTGSMTFMGKPVNEAFDGRSWVLEHLLWPFDEAGLSARDFDVSLINAGTQMPFMGDRKTAGACRLAIAVALTRLIPMVRVPLKKAGLLSVDRRVDLAPHPRYADGIRKGRAFAKR